MAVDFRYKTFGYLALNVTNLDASTRFLTEIYGLDMVGDGANGSRFFRAGAGHHDVILQQADSPAFVRSAWQLETEHDVDKAFSHYKHLGLETRWLSDKESYDLSIDRAFRVIEPMHGTTWEYYSAMSYVSTPRTNRLTAFQGGKHYGLVIPNCRETTAYMVENMGFLVSDYIETWTASLLRAFPNPNHHSFAPLQFPVGGGKVLFHHIAFMVNEIDDIGRYLNRAKKHDVKIQFGIGRHPTSGSIHLYLYDPDYFIWEYTLGMEQFPEVGPRQPRRMSSNPEDLDLWGATPDREHAHKLPGVLQNQPL